MNEAENHQVSRLTFSLPESDRSTEGCLLKSPGCRWLLVLGHGAGAGIFHPFMDSLARSLAGQRIATFRYFFPYLAEGLRRPDPPSLLTATVRAAVQAAGDLRPALPLVAGGKSLGGG